MVKCKCGSEKYHTETRSIHLAAICDSCGSHIKFIAQNEPQFYIGKYKGWKVAEMQDLPYMEWYIANVKCSGTFKQALIERIESVKTFSA